MTKKQPGLNSLQTSPVLFVIPTLGNRPKLLRKTLRSLAIQKPQPPDILLVCPDPKKVIVIAKQFGATVHKDTGSLSSALNSGFKLAKPWHLYGSWMGDDDLLREGSIKETTLALNNNPSAVLAYGYCDYVDSRDRVMFTSRAGLLAPWIMKWGPNLLPLPGILYRLSAAKEAGDYDEDLKYSMDLDMWLRLAKLGAFINTKKTLGAFRWHDSSTTVSNRANSLREAATVKRKHLPGYLRPLAPIWELPVRLATRIAVRRANKISNNR